MPAGRLAALVRAKYPGQYDNIPDAELETRILAKYPEYQKVVDAPEGLPAPPDPTQFEDRSLPTRFGEAMIKTGPPIPSVDQAVAALPAIGGTVGGVVGGIGGTVGGLGVGGVPGAIGGATLGGAGGEALRQLIQRARVEAGGKQPVPATPLEAAKDIGLGAAEQGAYEVANPILGAAARGLYSSALDVAPKVAKKFGDLVSRGLAENIPVTRGYGAKRAGELLTESGGRSRALAEAADVAGAAPVTSAELAPGLDEPLRKAANQWFQTEPLNELARLEQDLVTSRGPRSMAELEEAVREAGVRRTRGYEQQAALGPGPATRAEADIAVTNRARELLQERTPGLKAEKQRAKELLGLTKVLEKKRPTPLTATDVALYGTGGVVGSLLGGPIGAALGTSGAAYANALLKSPLAKSTTAIAIKKLARPALEALRYRSLLSMLGAEDDTNPPPNPQ